MSNVSTHVALAYAAGSDPVFHINGTNIGLNQLFGLYDAAGGTTSIASGASRQTWGYATGLAGHAAGDTWTAGDGAAFIQFDAAGNGVKRLFFGTLMRVL